MTTRSKVSRGPASNRLRPESADELGRRPVRAARLAITSQLDVNSLSKHETPLTRWFWQQIGGELIEEYCLISRGPMGSGRWTDGVVLPDRPTRRGQVGGTSSIGQERAIVVQTKPGRLTLSLMGQAYFAAQLLRKKWPEALVEAVALCTGADSVLVELFEQEAGCRVVLAPREAAGRVAD